MKIETLEKIDKCLYCDRKAEWIYFKRFFLTTEIKLLCNEHRKSFGVR